MRSTSRRRRINARPSASPANAESNHFLKYILPEAIHGDKIRIPEEFTRRFGKELSSEITITVPDGLVWKTELEKSAGEIWICYGWQEFKKYYSISHGFSLLFKYEGNSNFCVVITDMSAAEIYYPCRKQSNNEEPKFENHNSETECPRNRYSLGHSGYNTRSKNQNLEKQEEIIDVDCVSVPSLGESGTNVSCNPNEHSRRHGKDRSRQGYTSRMECKMRRKQKAIEAAKKFKPTNPSFTTTIRPSNLSQCYLNVPAPFARAYMRKLDSVIVKLQLSNGNGQKWEVRCSKDGCSLRMLRGWIGFARDNNLSVGDVCVFELIKRKPIVLKVTIFPT